MKNLTRHHFEELAKHGSIRKPTGQTPAGEDLCETALEFGLANGYSLADICHFYAHFQRKMNSLQKDQLSEPQVFDAAYDQFVRDTAIFAGTMLDAAKGFEQRSVLAAARETLHTFVQILAQIGKSFLSFKR